MSDCKLPILQRRARDAYLEQAVTPMVAESTQRRLELNTNPEPSRFHGAWWPESRRLEQQLAVLFSFWPSTEGQIERVRYSPPDWDDRPTEVQVGARLIKTGSFPRDDTKTLVLSITNGGERALRIIAPETAPEEAAAILENIAEGTLDPILGRMELDDPSLPGANATKQDP